MRKGVRLRLVAVFLRFGWWSCGRVGARRRMSAGSRTQHARNIWGGDRDLFEEVGSEDKIALLRTPVLEDAPSQ
jgi:hypothetical protein